MEVDGLIVLIDPHLWQRYHMIRVQDYSFQPTPDCEGTTLRPYGA
jgi:hypothetical protein